MANALLRRTSSRAMSRPNMLRALARIEGELGEIVGAAPSVRGDNQHLFEADVREKIRVTLKDIKWLWG